VVLYGFEEHCDLRPIEVVADARGIQCELVTRNGEGHSRVPVDLPLGGTHNLLNAMAVFAAARADGIEPGTIASALSRFEGVRRRQEVVGEGRGILVVDDFAHHPTAVRLTLDGLRQRYPDRNLVVALEPRSLTAARGMFFDDYFEALRRADRVWLAPVFHASRFADHERLDTQKLAANLSQAGTPARACASIEELRLLAVESLRPGDLFVTMSSGSFEGLPHKIAANLMR
jgi:UDP-N-acetylmuramate: L-alanyl-gamma-D-glutamyl-meso-diaminopimelate ligase